MRNLCNILWLSLCMCLAGCNNHVFIDDYLPDVPTIQLSETDTVARIAFKSDNWDILNIYGTYENVWGVICDLEGKPDGRNFPLENGENAVIKLGYDYCDFRVEKRNGRELCIFSGDNRNGKAFDVEIVVGNEYEIKSIPVSLVPTSKYEVDSIVYDWESLSYSDNMLEPDYWVMIDNTQSTQPTSWNFDPMESSFPHKISFRDKSGWNEEKQYKCFLGTPLPLVVIPDFIDGKPVLEDTKVEFGSDSQQIDNVINSSLVGKKYTIPPGEKWKISVDYLIEQYWINYKLYTSHPFSGRKKTFEGTIYSKRPYEFYITPEKQE